MTLTRDLILSVNVSAKQFRQADFVAQVQAAVQRHAINPKLLKLELTESLLLENIEDTIATMNALREIGVQFSLDDFGTGYSSLQYLKRLPLDQLKIDQSFVRDIATDSSDKAIVRTIIAMAQSLNLDVIAEGVETEEQRQLLLDKGCTHYQGYLFGKPIPIEQFETTWFSAMSGKVSEEKISLAFKSIEGTSILLAEDNPFNQLIAMEMLEHAGAKVVIANNGKEVLDLARREHFDCVLMDIQMPEMDGLEATRLLRADPSMVGLRVIAMTANNLQEDRDSCFAAGMDDFIGKPYFPSQLYTTIAKWLPQHLHSDAVVKNAPLNIPG